MVNQNNFSIKYMEDYKIQYVRLKKYCEVHVTYEEDVPFRESFAVSGIYIKEYNLTFEAFLELMDYGTSNKLYIKAGHFTKSDIFDEVGAFIGRAKRGFMNIPVRYLAFDADGFVERASMDLIEYDLYDEYILYETI
mgnify:CR=1 FL=1